MSYQSTLRPDIQVLVSLLLVLVAGAPIHAAWPSERSAGPFHVHADFSLKSYDRLIGEMGHLQRDLAETLGTGTPAEHVHVFLFHQKSTYVRYIQHYFPKVPSRRALYIKARGPGMVFAYRSRELEVDLRHESTHALLHAALPFVPLWLDEGLAEYFEVPKSERRSKNAHLATVKWAARFGQVPSLTRLEEITELRQMGRTEYRHAWAWTHFMLHGPQEARATLVAYMADLQANVPPGKLSRRLRQNVPDLDRRFLDHFKQWK